MMKHSKRFLCLLLTLILAASLCVFPAAAADQTCPSSKDDPVVFVHGLMGWAARRHQRRAALLGHDHRQPDKLPQLARL